MLWLSNLGAFILSKNYLVSSIAMIPPLDENGQVIEAAVRKHRDSRQNPFFIFLKN
jgi:hypothetical protein